MSKDVSVRYVPAFGGSPGWMSRAEAEREMARENDTIDALVAAGGLPRAAARPYIHVPAPERARRPRR
jgi:hypothetical protein